MRKKICFVAFTVLASVLSSLAIARPIMAATDFCPGSTNPLAITRWCENMTEDEFVKWKSGGRDAMTGTIKKIILNISNMILEIGAYIAVALVMYGGFMYVTSSGDPSKAARGRAVISNSIIGLIITRVSSLIITTFREFGDIAAKSGTIGQTAAALANEFLFWGGALCVIMILWGGLQYVTSAGDPGKATKAKKTIVYSIIGLIIMAFGGAIVAFALGSLR